eukprot:scaffold199465_cov46-Tisochrysis_lutea.AAC.2
MHSCERRSQQPTEAGQPCAQDGLQAWHFVDNPIHNMIQTQDLDVRLRGSAPRFLYYVKRAG